MKIKEFNAKYSYEYDLDMVNIEIKKDVEFKKSVDLEIGVYLNFDDKCFPVNLEITDASKVIGSDKNFLISPLISLKIEITKNFIKTELLFQNSGQNFIKYWKRDTNAQIEGCEREFIFSNRLNISFD